MEYHLLAVYVGYDKSSILRNSVVSLLFYSCESSVVATQLQLHSTI
jgi:hypothetical protein